MSALPIVDAHQHFWDLERNYHPWLSDAPPANFRYGDTAPLRRNYLPQDYLADCAAHRVVATVHMEAEWDPRDPVGETRWLAELRRKTGFPTAAIGQAWFDRDDIAEVLAGHAQLRFRARRAAEAEDGGVTRCSRRRRARHDERSALARRLCAARAPRPVLRPAGAVVAHGRGRRARARLSAHADHRQSHGAAGRPQRRSARRLAQRARDGRRAAERHAEDLRARDPARTLERRSAMPRSCATRSASSARTAACSQAIFRSTAWSAASTRSSPASRRSSPTCRRIEQRMLFHDNAVRMYRLRVPQ